MGRHVRELVGACGITGHQNVREPRLQVLIGFNGGLGADTQGLKAIPLHTGFAPQGTECIIKQHTHFVPVVVQHSLAALRVVGEGSDAVAEQHGHSLGAQLFSHQRRDFLVFTGQQAFAHFNQGDCGTQPRKSLREFAPDRPATHDKKAGWGLLAAIHRSPQCVAVQDASLVHAG